MWHQSVQRSGELREVAESVPQQPHKARQKRIERNAQEASFSHSLQVFLGSGLIQIEREQDSLAKIFSILMTQNQKPERIDSKKIEKKAQSMLQGIRNACIRQKSECEGELEQWKKRCRNRIKRFETLQAKASRYRMIGQKAQVEVQICQTFIELIESEQRSFLTSI